MIKINLLAEGKRPTAVRRTKATGVSRSRLPQLPQLLLIATLLLSLLGVGLWWWVLNSKLTSTREAVKRAEQEVKELAPIIKEVEDFKAKTTELKHQIEVITDLKANQRGPVRMMDEISRALPELLWLTKVEMSRSLVKVSGKAFNSNAVASFIESLAHVPEFKEPELLELKQEKDSYAFNLQFGFKPAAASTAPPVVPPAGDATNPATTGTTPSSASPAPTSATGG